MTMSLGKETTVVNQTDIIVAAKEVVNEDTARTPVTLETVTVIVTSQVEKGLVIATIQGTEGIEETTRLEKTATERNRIKKEVIVEGKRIFL